MTILKFISGEIAEKCKFSFTKVTWVTTKKKTDNFYFFVKLKWVIKNGLKKLAKYGTMNLIVNRECQKQFQIFIERTFHLQYSQLICNSSTGIY